MIGPLERFIARWLWLWIPAAAIVGVYLYFSDPEHKNVFPPCTLHELTGLHCLACGATRASHHLVHGRILRALRCNALLVVGVIGLTYWTVADWINSRSRYRIPNFKITPYLICGIIAVLLLFLVLRNIKIFPLTLLAP